MSKKSLRILSIETSCDETGIAILEQDQHGVVTVLGNALASQIAIHAEYGGVFPALAKRAHAEKITFLIEQALSDAELLEAISTPRTGVSGALSFLNEKESTLKEHITPFLTYYDTPRIDAICVTVGPGLEPALWVGVNAARALGTIWDIPITAVNHMEGHFVTAAFTPIEQEGAQKSYTLHDIAFPALALLVSGGHTELVTAENFGTYQKIGQTRDDAVGEAFDKVARILGLPYPGGPAVSRLAQEWRESGNTPLFELPRPMLHSGDTDFSFSGIKTAVLYTVRDLGREMTDEDKRALACEFETAVVEVLVKKTVRAIHEHGVQTVVVGGGVAGNSYLRSELTRAIKKEFPHVVLLFPEPWLATDNAIMIGMAGILTIDTGKTSLHQGSAGQTKTSAPSELKADGNLSL